MEAKRKATFGAWFATFVLCYFFWILLTGSFAWQELVAGAVVSAGVALFSARWFVHESPGRFFGKRLFNNPDSKIFKRSHLEKTHEFYKKYGGKTIIIARFVPIVRTFAPFVAGMGKMHYYYFMMYNVVGGAFWVALFCYAGYFFGDLPFVQENLKVLVVAIIFISLLPAIIEVMRERAKLRKQQKS